MRELGQGVSLRVGRQNAPFVCTKRGLDLHDGIYQAQEQVGGGMMLPMYLQIHGNAADLDVILVMLSRN